MLLNRLKPFTAVELTFRGAFFFLATLVFILFGNLPSVDASSLTRTYFLKENPVPERELTVSSGQIPSWKAEWDSARQQFRAGNYQAARDLYENLLRRRRDLIEVGRELAIVHLHLGNNDQSASLFEELLEYDAVNAVFRKGVGVALLAGGNPERAAGFFDAVLKDFPDDVTALAGIAESWAALGLRSEASATLNRLHSLIPDDPAVEGLLAELLFEQGRYDQAGQHLAAVAEEVKEDEGLLRKTAVAYEKAGSFDQAADYWQRLLAAFPEAHDSRMHLADIAEQKGQLQRALGYLQPLLDLQVYTPRLFKRVGMLYQRTGRYDQALPLLEGYSRAVPDDAEVLRELVQNYINSGNNVNALTALEKIIALEQRPDPGELQLAARLYHGFGYHEDAFRMYDSILDLRPMNDDVITDIAAMLLDMPPASSEPFWEGLEKKGVLLEILEKIHEGAPQNAFMSLRLATLFYERGDTDKSRKLLDLLPEEGVDDPVFFTRRAELFEKMQRPQAALADYERLLARDREDREIRMRGLRLAGSLGLLGAVRRHDRELDASGTIEGNAEHLFLRGEAYSGCMVYETARNAYEKILGMKEGVSLQTRHEALLATARLHRQADLPYEAEQYLRQAFVLAYDRAGALEALFRLALDEGRFAEAETWFSHLNVLFVNGMQSASRMNLLKAELLLARGDIRPARKILARLQEQSADTSAGVISPATAEVYAAAEILLARAFFEEGDLAAAEKLLSDAIARGNDTVDSQGLLAAIRWQAGDGQQARALVDDLFRTHNNDFGLQLHVIRLVDQLGFRAFMTELAAAAVERQPESTAAIFLLARSRQLLGDFPGAIATLKNMAQSMPGDYLVNYTLARLFFRAGDLDNSLEMLDRIKGSGASLPAGELLRARIYWEQQEWKDSRRIYLAHLLPSVEELFSSRCADLGVSGPLPQARRTFWDILSFRVKRKTGSLDEIMDPAFAGAAAPEDAAYNAAAAPLYAQYRWQDLFAREVDAKQAIVRKEYFYAVKEYERLTREYRDEEPLLFDLAGVYSNLGRLEEEAAIYQRLSSLNPGYTGLSEGMERNRLKRRPRGGLGIGYDREEGRDGYVDIKKARKEVFATFSPRVRHEADLTLSRIHYDPASDGISLLSNRVLALYQIGVSDWLDLKFGGGVQSLDNGYSDIGLVDLGIAAKLGDFGIARVDFERDATSDTTASLARGIVQERLAGRLEFDPVPRLLTGGKYDLIDYTDENTSTQYGIWASYHLITDPIQLSVGYSYDFFDSKEDATPGEPGPDGFAPDDHPYWSPSDYWVNAFNAALEYRFGDDSFERGAPRYCRANYILGHDSKGYAFQTIEGDIFVEITPSFLVDAHASVSTSQVFRSREVYVSAVYRW